MKNEIRELKYLSMLQKMTNFAPLFRRESVMGNLLQIRD